MRDTKRKGNLAELVVAAQLVERGFSLSLPYGDNAPYDLVAEAPSGKLYRLQVRWCSWRKEVLTVSLQKSSHSKCSQIDLGRVDAMVAFDGESVYVVPTSEITTETALCLRRAAPKNNQKEGIRFAAKYKERYDFLA